MNNDSLRTSLHDHLRGNHFPPLPVEYVDWVVNLIPNMKQAVYDSHFGDSNGLDQMIKIPQNVVSTGVLPRRKVEREDGIYVRLGDLVSGLHLESYLDDEVGEE